MELNFSCCMIGDTSRLIPLSCFVFYTLLVRSLYYRWARLTRTCILSVFSTKQSRNCDEWMCTTKLCLPQRRVLYKPHPSCREASKREWHGLCITKSLSFPLVVFWANTATIKPASFELMSLPDAPCLETPLLSSCQSNRHQGDPPVP